ncbi:MAG: nicotinate-nucleotide adenylyltransferase [Termitinemataceae bacterium]|nr:MAG: nicotinate-nucleotide adenylyltransferase [Termitinemataceae bacterium]
MKYAIFGGSFDPFHNGHKLLAEEALTCIEGVCERQLENCGTRVIFVPAYQSPFKVANQKDNCAQRIEMLLAAISGDTRFTVDTCEVSRQGISYTIDTLNDILERYRSDTKIAMLVGDDLLADFHKWRGADEIAAKADLIIAHRTNELLDFHYPHTMLDNDVIQISSREVRSLIASGRQWEHLVPSQTACLIKERGYYEYKNKNHHGRAAGYFCSPEELHSGSNKRNIVEIEDTVRGMLNQHRFIHSRNAALHCYDLCVRFGIDPTRGYIAGITHDMCKDFSDAQLIDLARKDGLPFSELEKRKPQLLHGRAAAIFLQERFGFDNKKDHSLIEAVRYHTSGISTIDDLGKIVYLTDKIEVGRYTVDPMLRRIAFTSKGADKTLEQIFRIVLEATYEYLVNRGHAVSKDTLDLLRTPSFSNSEESCE